MKILTNHDHTKSIGTIDNKFIGVFDKPMPYHDFCFNYGIRILEAVEIDGVRHIKKFQLVEISLDLDLQDEENIKEIE